MCKMFLSKMYICNNIGMKVHKEKPLFYIGVETGGALIINN